LNRKQMVMFRDASDWLMSLAQSTETIYSVSAMNDVENYILHRPWPDISWLAANRGFASG
jgi:hypothetical protein